MEKSSAIQTDLIADESLIETWVHRWGGAVSEMTLDPTCHLFQVPGIEGFIGYQVESGCLVVFGDPICAPEEMPALALAFYNYCRERRLDFIYIIVSERFAKWAIRNICKIMIEIGEELTFDPREDPKQGSRGYRLRNRIRHAKHQGLTFHEYFPIDPQLEEAMQQVGNAWLRGRRGPQIYLGRVNLFENRTDKRWFYLKRDDQVMGTALISKLESRQGWLLKSLIITPEAPRGSSELLMMSILETLRDEGCHYLTYGMVPKRHLGEIEGLNAFSAWIAQRAYKIAKWIFKLEHRRTYWLKFDPISEKSFLLFSKPNLGFQEIRAILKTLKIDYNM
jgi:lysylphosphatidylglycerol synthetase-like protein (DUF2156 family)